MFSTIVVGTDGSPNAETALRAAVDLQKQLPDAEVHVVMAYHPLSAVELATMSERLPDELRPLLHAHMGAERVLNQAKTLFESAGAEAKFHELDDDPTDALLEVVEQVGADLVVVGSRGEGLAKRALHGSVSTKVLHHVPCSVLVVKSED